MTASPDAPELRGLAGSIQRLFAQDPPAGTGDVREGETGPDTHGGVAWVTESGVRLPGAERATEPLLAAVRRYLGAAPGERVGVRDEVEAAVVEARDRRAWTVLADAAAALARFSEREPEALVLAREMVSPAVAVVLVERVRDAADDEGRRLEAVEILPRLGPEMEVGVLDGLRREALDPEADRSVRRTLLAVVSAMADGGSHIVSRMLDDADWRVVRNGIHILGEREGEEALPLLRRAVEHDDPRVRREALGVLAKLGGDEVGVLAKVRLEDPDPRVRAQAARTVGLLHVELALRPLLALMEDEDEEAVILEVIRSLGLLGDLAAVPALERRASPSLFTRTSQEVRVAAYRALAAIGSPHALELLQTAREDKDPEVRRTAQAALQARNG